MSENDPHFETGEYAGEHAWGSSIHLRLERYGARRRDIDLTGRRAVLLLHGASANHKTFTVPRVGLADWLLDKGLDPWLLDWRGSSLVVDDDANHETLAKKPFLYTLSHAAEEDLPAAISRMRKNYQVKGPISVLGHCMGGAVIAEAVASGHLERPELNVDRVALLALGLFYEAPIDSRLKSEERLLERLVNTGATLGIDPRVGLEPTQFGPGAVARWPWQEDIKRLYDVWPQALQWHATQMDDANGDTVEALCNRVSFMYGMPYYEPNLIDTFHPPCKPLDDETAAAEALEVQRLAREKSRREELEGRFGGIPLHLYLHCARNLRQGQAMIATGNPPYGQPVVSGKQRFLSLARVTVMTGALNRLWHRDSIDRMYEWLTRGCVRRACHVRKRVFEGYGHQDLLWGPHSPEDVYPTILDAVREAPGPNTAVSAGAISQGAPAPPHTASAPEASQLPYPEPSGT